MRPSSQTPVGFEPTTFRKREDHSRPTATWSTIGQTCGHSGDRTRDLTHFQATALPFELRRRGIVEHLDRPGGRATLLPRQVTPARVRTREQLGVSRVLVHQAHAAQQWSPVGRAPLGQYEHSTCSPGCTGLASKVVAKERCSRLERRVTPYGLARDISFQKRLVLGVVAAGYLSVVPVRVTASIYSEVDAQCTLPAKKLSTAEHPIRVVNYYPVRAVGFGPQLTEHSKVDSGCFDAPRTNL